VAAEPFIPPPEPAPADLGVRSAWALGFIGFGLAIAGAVLAYMLPQSIEAQWRNPPTHGVVTKVERRQGSDDSSTWYRIAWTTPAGEERTGSISPLLESFHVGQRVPLRYAHRAGADPRLFLDTWLEVWGPPTGILVVTLALLGSAAVEIVARLLRARRARGPTPGSDPSP
jgi:hypothetical protein